MKKLFLSLVSLALLLNFTGCLSKDRADTNSLSKSTTSGTVGEILVKTVFPATPVVTLGGTLKITSVVTDISGNYLESTLSNPVTVSWSSSNKSVVTIDESGTLYGVGEGEATISLYATHGSAKSKTYEVTVQVVNINTVDVAEVYLSLNSAYIDIGATRSFRLTAVDSSGAQTSLSEGSVEFVISNDNISIDKETITLAPGGAPVEITITGNSKGYSFVTPVYNITENGTTVKITGTPLIVQVKDPAESSKPEDQSVDAGKYLSVALNEVDGKKIVHVAHYDQAYESFSYSVFDGSWNHDYSALPLYLHSGDGAKMVLSPFSENLNKPIAVMMQDDKATLWYQNWPENYWLETPITTTSIRDLQTLSDVNSSDENASTYDETLYPIAKTRYLDIVSYTDSNDSSNNRIHVAYFDTVQNQICILTYTSPSAYSHNQCFSTSVNGSAGEVRDISLSVNSINGEPRLIYTEMNSSMYYVARQNDKIYREKVTNSTGNEKGAVLKLDKNNVPMIVCYSGIQIGTFYRTKVDGSFTWAFKNISGLDPIPTKINSVDFDFDSYNEPKVAFSADDKIRYARRISFNNNKDKWVVEAPGDAGSGVQGEYVSIVVDSTNRAHIVYTDADTKWFSYWAEPNFFDYRVFPETNYVGADVIE